MDDDSDKKPAKFNSGLSKLERIDNIKKLLVRAKIEDNFGAWYRLLGCFLDEVWEFLNKTERESVDKLSNRANLCLSINDRFFMNDNIKKKSLINFERFLLDVEHKYHLSMPSKESDGAAANDVN